MKRICLFIALLMALFLILLFSACEKITTEFEDEGSVFGYESVAYIEQNKSENAAEELSYPMGSEFSGQLLPVLDDGESVLSSCVQNDRIYYLTRSIDEKTWSVHCRIYVMEDDGSEQTLIVNETSTSPEASQKMGYLYSIGIQSFCACEDGSVWYMVNDLAYMVRTVVHVDVSGNALASIDSEGIFFLLPLSDGGPSSRTTAGGRMPPF